MKLPIHNIFSREKTTESKKVKIVIDHREKNSLIPSYLENDFEIEFKQLPVADYLVKDTAIERKTVSDLKNSIKNKRIIQQLLELKQYPSHILLVEGIIEDDIYSSPGLHENALRGFLLSVALEFKTPIIFTHNEKDTAKYIRVLAKKQTRPDTSIRASKIALSKKEQQQFILEGFPHIGGTKAQALLEKFKTLEKIFSASEEELSEILGKRAKDFKELLD
jgi:ERCC4-type nuclease